MQMGTTLSLCPYDAAARDIGLVTPYYLLMHRDMQQTPKVRAFADFAGAEIKSFRALVSKEAGASR
jgi:DNA-binding transcriptional LysR family regulator